VKSREQRKVKADERNNGPGLLFIAVVLVAVTLVGARFLGFSPGGILTMSDRPIGSQDDKSSLDNQQESDDSPTAVKKAEPLVLIYHAHASENYSPKPAHAKEGTAGDVIEIGKELARWLKDLNIEVIHVTGVYDFPWGKAYEQSRKAVKSILEQNPSIKLVIDIHRDAIEQPKGMSTTAAVGEDDVAKIFLVVGETNNPNLAANINMAQNLKDQLEKEFPGITRGVRILPQESNGSLHPGLIQLHIGEYKENSLAEAKASTQYLAKAISEILK
jgi:stage II sporulation protein P